MIKFTVPGITPSKKNNKRPFIRNGRIMLFPSKQYVNWHKTASKTLLECPITNEPIKNVELAILTFYAPDNRKYDLTNKAESIMDLMVDCNILDDDNYSVVPNLQLVFGGVDRDNPRCDVILDF